MMKDLTCITHLLGQAVRDDGEARDRLMEAVYKELRQMATARMSKADGQHTLQPTALVHEAWLKLADGEGKLAFENRAHFFGAASEAMRRILVDRARQRMAAKHGGGLVRSSIDEQDIVAPPAPDDQVLAVHGALDEFAVHHARKAELVKLRFFVGLGLQEAAKILGISLATAKRDWVFARSWLFRAITSDGLIRMRSGDADAIK